MPGRSSRGPSVENVKADVRARDGHRCTKCGMTAALHRERYGRTLDVHRLVPGSVYTVDGSVSICKACHGPQARGEKGQPDLGNRTGEPLTVYLARDLANALRRYLEETRPAPTKTDVVSFSLEEFLRGKGYWPPDVPAAETDEAGSSQDASPDEPPRKPKRKP